MSLRDLSFHLNDSHLNQLGKAEQITVFCLLKTVLCKRLMAKPFKREALTACMHTVSGSISLPLAGFFSPFPHGTGSLSVSKEYLALEDGPPMFSQSFTCSDLLFVAPQNHLSCTGLSPSMAELSRSFH